MVTAAGWTRRGSLLAVAGVVSALAAASSTAAAPETQGTGTASTTDAAAATTTATDTLHVLGDSWAAGLYADPAHALGQVAAAAIGWQSSVDAISGTGFLNAAGAETYLQRAKTGGSGARLVVVQGGSNDDAEDTAELAAAVTATIAALRTTFPVAQIMFLGPGPDPEPVTDLQRQVDDIIGTAVKAAGLPYVSMLQDQWIPSAYAAAVLDPDNHHPTVSGQDYLGLRLAASLRLLFPNIIGT